MKQKKILGSYSFKKFSTYRINGGLLLILVSMIAIIVANSPWADAYHKFWTQPVLLQFGNFNLFSHNGHPLTLMQFINDALMAIFFFSVGLEIKREIMVGELSSLRNSLLPVIAAIGGMICPVIIYYSLTHGTPESSGMAIPMATDIAFSLGVLSLLGNRVPMSLKIFLTAFAVVDDIGGILVIAIFYSSHLNIIYLLYAFFAFIILLLANRMKITKPWIYLICGTIIWYLFLQSGIHSSISGVIVAMTIPAIPRINVDKYVEYMKQSLNNFHTGQGEKILSNEQIDDLRKINGISSKVISPLQSMEKNLHGVVNYFIMPVFAFANAGISFSGEMGFQLGTVTIAIMLGLVIGKFVGIFLFTFLTIKTKLSSMPAGMNWKNICGISLIGGIGFTVSLFIANLSFDTPETALFLEQAKFGVLLGTSIAGILGYMVLNIVLPKNNAVSF